MDRRPQASETLQLYLGHKPSSVLAAHYDHVSRERLAEIADLAEQLSQGAGAFAENAKTGRKDDGFLH